MLQPVGPLSASVYWRRRAIAAAVVLLVLVVGWQLLSGGGGGDGGRRNTAGAAGSPAPTDDASASLAATPPPGDPGRPGDGSGSGTRPAGTGTAVPATTTAPAPKTTPAPTTPAATPAAPPKPCADRALRLRVIPERGTYQVGQTPVLDLEVRNVSTTACVRDLGAAQQEILLYAGSTRLWSSNDCYPEGERADTVLRPGAVERFEVKWSGLGSRPKCAGTRARVGPGRYTLLARLGTLISPRAPITLR